MRETTLRALDGTLNLSLGSDTTIIGEVMEIGRYIPDLIYKANLNGVDTINLLKKCRVNEEIISQIKEDKMYELTSYDW